jgi:hypothetical protein
MTTSDIGASLSFQVTATNNRGATSVVSASQTVLPALTSITLTDTTITPPGPPSVTGTGGNFAWSASWTVPSPATWVSGYAVGASPVQVGETISYAGGFNTTASATSAPAGSTQVLVLSKNTYGQFDVSWSPATGATSYDIYVGGVLKQNTTATSVSGVFVGSVGLTSVTVYPKYNTTQGYGASNTVTLNEKQSAFTYSPAFTVIDPTPGSFTVNSPTDLTSTPSAISSASLTFAGSNTFNASWGSSTGATEYLAQYSGIYSNVLYYTTTAANGVGPYTSTGTQYLTVTPVNQSCIAYFSWTASTNATSYTISYNLGDGGGVRSLTGVTGTTYAFAMTSGNTFTLYSVTAVNSYGNRLGSGSGSVYVSTKLGGSASTSAGFIYTPPPSPPTTPGTPTLVYVSANAASWSYTASWAASTGSVPITYYLPAVGNAGGSTTKGGFSTNSGSFTLPQTDSLWQVAAYATNSVGTSGTSGYSNSA